MSIFNYAIQLFKFIRFIYNSSPVNREYWFLFVPQSSSNTPDDESDETNNDPQEQDRDGMVGMTKEKEKSR